MAKKASKKASKTADTPRRAAAKKPHRKASASIRIKRAYDPPAEDDGLRILIDRLWPRGLAKSKLKLDAWPKHLSPSNALRKWYRHDPEKFAESYQHSLPPNHRESGRVTRTRRQTPLA